MAVVTGGVADATDVRQPWWERGSCRRGNNAEAFFPEKGKSNHDAKIICGSCPVKIECLNYAIRRREPYGIWGGKSPHERRKLIQDARRTPEEAGQPPAA